MLEQIDAWLTSNNLTYDAERRDFAFATDGPWDLMHFLDGESLSSHVRPQGLRTYCTYGPRAPAFCVLYVPEAQGSLPPGSHVLFFRGTRTRLGRTVPYVPRTVATQVIGSANSATWHKKSAEAPEAEQAEPHLLLG